MKQIKLLKFFGRWESDFKFWSLKGKLRPKFCPCFLIFFVNLRGKSFFRKKVFRCYDYFSRSYEFAKFWIRRKWRHPRECTLYFTLVFLHIFVSFMDETPSTKLESYEVLNYQTVSRRKWCHPLCINIHNILIVAYI